ncbi:MAG TPA: succinate dehydrogenase hydrophobic membrane anchor subunit [Acidimicrobiales bacterium]|nr:succinate dehydrogenase hydrophobic membrane anchor subunit [Acidimicrobiales bacterium]
MTTLDTPPPKTRARTRTRSPEAWSWIFMRLSGLALVFLALIHFTVTHIVNDVVETDYDFVAERWHNPAWRVFDWLLLVLALGHGVNGLRWIVDDFVRSPGRRKAVKAVLYGLTGVLVIVGTLTILAFPTRPR